MTATADGFFSEHNESSTDLESYDYAVAGLDESNQTLCNQAFPAYRQIDCVLKASK